MFYSLYFESKIRRNIFSNTFGEAKFITGDTRRLAQFTSEKVDWIITSPPYGTAVDYVGNDVYSLYLLGLSTDHLAIDRNTIGSMKMLPQSSNLKEIELPSCVISPLNQLFRTNPRKARALAAYYENIALAFQQMKEVLKQGGRLVVIIGAEQDFPNDEQKIKLPIAESMKELGSHYNLDFIEEKMIKLAKNSYGGIFAESILTFGK
jgi:tRNA G10  N-methylase Trm11